MKRSDFNWIEERNRKIEEQNKKITHIVWIIFLSMMTSIFTTLATTGQLEMWLQKLR